MTQMELAHEVVAAKRRERGEAGLNEADHAHQRRQHELDPDRCALLHPLPPGSAPPDIEAAPALDSLVAHLSARGLPAFAVNLTRPELGVPVVRVLCPGLDREPSRLIGARLRATITATGGGEAYTHGIPLL
jgi:ribosomal protein S12 methylthiotransferase accessory factor YcaO